MTALQIMEMIRPYAHYVVCHTGSDNAYFGFLTCDEKLEVGQKLNPTKCTFLPSSVCWGDLSSLEYSVSKHTNFYGHYTYIIGDEYRGGKYDLAEYQMIYDGPVVIGLVHETENCKHNTKNWYRTDDGRTIGIDNYGREIYINPDLG